MFDLVVQWLIVAVDVSVKAVVLAAIASLTLRLLRLRDSNLRHRMWTGVLIGMLVLPALSQTVPGLQLPFAVPEHWRIGQWDDVSLPTANAPDAAIAAERLVIDVSQESPSTIAANQPLGVFGGPRTEWSGAELFTLSDVGPESEMGAAELNVEVIDSIHSTATETHDTEVEVASITPASSVEEPRPPSWLVVMLALWLAGAVVMTLRLLAGVAYSLRLAWSSTVIAMKDLVELGVDSRCLANDERRTLICESPLIRVPMALGVFRPRILLPSDWATWSTEKLTAVIAHERTHVQRADGAVVLLAEVNRCLYWFHPLAWWLRSHLGQLAETACDDAAIDWTGDRATYARHLLEVASAVSGHRSRLITVGISMARPSNVETRINTILDFTRPLSKQLTWTKTLLLLGALIPLITLAAAVRPSTDTKPQSSLDEATADVDIEQSPQDVKPTGAEEEAPLGLVADATTEDGPEAEPQPPAPAADESAADDPKTLSVDGIVLDPDGAPVSSATVQIVHAHRPRWYAAPTTASVLATLTTPENGRFESVVPLDDLEISTNGQSEIPEWMSVIATAPGYGFGFAAISQSQSDEPIKIQLAPPQLIHGRLVDLEGQPIAGASVSVFTVGFSESSEKVDEWLAAIPENLSFDDQDIIGEWVPAVTGPRFPGYTRRQISPDHFSRVVTDDDGRFELSGLGCDRVAVLLVTAPGFTQSMIEVLTRPLEKPVRAMTMWHLGNTKAFYGADFTFVVAPSIPVEGVVRDLDSRQPIVGANVMVYSLAGTTWSHDGYIVTTTDDEGHYTIEGLPIGEKNRLKVVADGQPYLITDSITLPESHELQPIEYDIELPRAVWATGHLLDESTGEPVQGTVHFTPFHGNTLAERYPQYADQVTTLIGNGQDYQTDAEGRFRIPVTPGRGLLCAKAFSDLYRTGYGAEKIEELVPFLTNANAGEMPTFDHAVPSIFHALREIDPPADAEEFAVDLLVDRGLTQDFIFTDPDGQPLTDVLVGGVKILPRSSDPPSDLVTVVGLTAGTAITVQARHIERNLGALVDIVPEGNAGTQTIVLHPPTTVRGRLIDSQGEPLSGASITPRWTNAGGWSNSLSSVTTDKNGEFTVELLPGESYNLLAREERSAPLTEDLEAEPGLAINLGDLVIDRDAKEWTPAEPKREPVITPAQQEATPSENAARDLPSSPTTRSYSGRIETPEGEPIAGAKIWLAVASHMYTGEANRNNREGLLRELGTTNEQGRFEVVLDAVTTQEIRKRFQFSQAHLVATAEGRGLDWMPLDVFEDNPAPSEKRDTLQSRIDQSLGDGTFASRALKLRPESQPVLGRLVDLEGHPLPKVTVSVESLRQPDITRLLKAFEMSWRREMNEAFSATSFGSGLLARSELQRLIPPVTTDENGEFAIRGLGDDQLFKLVFKADRVEARPVYVLGREMETVSLPNDDSNPAGAKVVFMGRDFTYAVGPSVTVEGIVTDYDTGEPVAGVLVYVERLFKEGSVNYEQLRLDTHHMRAVTDGQGRFRITGMPPGEGHVLEVIPPKSEPYLMISQDVSLSLEDGDAKRIEFQVKRGIWIEGRVTDKQSGEPLSATVDYFALKKNPHALDKLGLNRAWNDYQQRYVTDSDGHYRTLGLPGPGVLLVKSQVPGYPLAAGAETIEGYDASIRVIPTTPYPLRVKDWHLLKQIDSAADAISLTSDLVLDAGLSIPGRVLGPDGKPITDLHVLGQTESFPWWRPRHDDKVRMTDRFTVNGYDGNGPRQLFFKNQDETLVGQHRLEGVAPEEIVVTLQPSVRVTGRVIANETELPAARYFLNCEKCSLFDEKYPTVKFSTHWCFTDDEGRFEIKGLMAGLVYKMIARNDSGSNDPDPNRFTIDLTAAKPGDVIELGDVTGDQGEQTNRTERLSPPSDDSEGVGEVEMTESTDAIEPTTKRDDAIASISYSGRVETPDGDPIPGAKIWLAMASYEEDTKGLLRELGTADEQGQFHVTLDAAATQAVRKRLSLWQTTLVATAEGRGLDWIPLDVFDDNPTPSDERDTLQAHIDQKLGTMRFASRTLKLRPAARPIRGRLLDLDGHPLPNVTVLVEGLQQPDIPLLLKAFKESSKDGFYTAINATGIQQPTRDELQRLILPVTTDENGAFELAGIGDDQLVSLSFAGEGVQAQVVHVLGRSMETVRIPHISSYPNGAKEVYAGRDFTYVLGPSVTVEGVVKDYDTGEPVARTLVKVERLFSERGGAIEGQLRLDTRHMRTMTDADGRFRMTGMPPGIGHVLEAIPPKSEPYLLASQDVTLSLDDGPAKAIEIPVKKGIWIEGQVTDEQSGQPLSGTVDYLALEKNPHTLDKRGLRQAWQFHRYRINSDGRYRTLGLPGPGVVLVQAKGGYPRTVGAETVDGYEANDSGGWLNTNPISLPLSNWNFIKQIDPEPDATSFTCDVALDAGLSIPGRVVGPDGESIADLNVLGEVANIAYWKLHATNTFTVEGYDGEGPRQLFFKNKDETLVGHFRLEGDAPEEIVVTLQPSVRVTGRLIENETELPAARYGLHCDKSSLFNDTSLGTKFRIDGCRTDDEGRFEIRGLVPGIIYDMDAANPQHFVNGRNEFQIDLTTAKPGDVIELGDVTGPNSDRPEGQSDTSDQME